jgi:hypothetical protein
VTLPDRVRAFVEDWLPWYDQRLERARNGRTEAIRLRAIKERQNVERILADYKETDDFVILERRNK